MFLHTHSNRSGGVNLQTFFHSEGLGVVVDVYNVFPNTLGCLASLWLGISERVHPSYDRAQIYQNSKEPTFNWDTGLLQAMCFMVFEYLISEGHRNPPS